MNVPDREDVIAGIQKCVARRIDGCTWMCPYLGKTDDSYAVPKTCQELLLDDIVELMAWKKEEAGYIIANLREDIDLLTHDRQPTAEEMKIVNDISTVIAMMEKEQHATAD